MVGPALALLAALFTSAPATLPAADAGFAGAVAGPRQVRIASCESRIAPRQLATRDPARALRADLEAALDAIDWKREGVHRPVEILAVLAEAESRADRGRARASVTVRAVVREPGGALIAVVSGNARGEDRAAARADLERDVLQAAAKQTSTSLPEAIRRARGEGRAARR